MEYLIVLLLLVIICMLLVVILSLQESQAVLTAILVASIPVALVLACLSVTSLIGYGIYCCGSYFLGPSLGIVAVAIYGLYLLSRVWALWDELTA